jgi:hypothetical protein
VFFLTPDSNACTLVDAVAECTGNNFPGVAPNPETAFAVRMRPRQIPGYNKRALRWAPAAMRFGDIPYVHSQRYIRSP